MTPIGSRITRRKRPTCQRGMVTLVIMLFLIATVVFALSQMLDVSSGNVIDGQRQGDTTAAFFLAESGLEKAQASVNAALAGNFSNASCTGIATNYSLGRGSVSVTAVSEPATCDNSGGTPCSSCTVTSTGRVGFSNRTVTQNMALSVTNGVTCNGANGCSNSPTVTWRLNLKNTAAVAGIGVFNLTYVRQGNNQATCAAGSNCRLQLDLSSPSNGVNAVGLMGNSVLIPASTSYPIYQTMRVDRDNLAEVGAFFLGTTAPVLTGPTANPGAASYWDDNKNDVAPTVGPSGSTTGGTNDGTATTGGTCSAPSAHSQACTSWCYGGDTLVYSFAASVTLLTDQLSSVTFGTSPGVQMTRVAKYPTTAVTRAPTNVDAEIWYARNPNFTGASPLAVNASSYKGRGTGAVGASWTSNGSDTTAISGTTLTVGNSFAGYPTTRFISVGDTISNAGGSGSPTCTTNCGTITAQLTSTEPGGMATGRGGRGTYQISGTQTVAAQNNRVWTISSTVLRVTACTICYFADTDALSGLIGGRTISSQASASNVYGLAETTGGIGRYAISGTATYVASGSNLYAGTPGTTLYLPSSSSQPSVTNPAMLITVKSGTGVLAPGTTVTAVSAPNAATTAFTASAAPTTALDGASLCAGTCAFFVPGATATTPFTLGGVTSNFNEWASGFTCLKGVDITPQVVTGSRPDYGRWTEVIQ
jgi:hypothetical protein